MLSGPSVVWDRRWRITLDRAPSPDIFIAALGEAGLGVLATSEDWAPTEDWAAAPREVRLTTPALWADNGRLLAAPLARFTDKIAETWAIKAKNLAAEADPQAIASILLDENPFSDP